MLAGGQYDGCVDPHIPLSLSLSLSLSQMLCQSHVFYFGNSETLRFILQSTIFLSLYLSSRSYLAGYYY